VAIGRLKKRNSRCKRKGRQRKLGLKGKKLAEKGICRLVKEKIVDFSYSIFCNSGC